MTPPSPDDERCRVCGERRGDHVATAKGPLTHPREARGEGTYVLRGFGTVGESFPGRGDEREWERWEFVPAARPSPPS